MIEQWLFNLPHCTVEQVEEQDGKVMFKAHTTRRDASCPHCRATSTKVHSYYTRTAQDLPLGEHTVCLKLTCRRFRCQNPLCPKRTFAEPLVDVLPAYARRTKRLTKALYHAGQALGGQAASRLLTYLHMPTSGSTILRILRREHVLPGSHPCILGVDDWAWRKGHTYGTILVDLETHTVFDLLPDRTSGTLANRLAAMRQVSVVARDRSTEYAKGISDGAPQARQVADRWHLYQNFAQALERALGQIYAQLRSLQPLTTPSAQRPEQTSRRTEIYPRSRSDLKAKQASRERRLALYQEIQGLRQKGLSIHQIANRLHRHRATVRKYFYADAFPERASKPLMSSILDPYIPYLTRRHQEGCENARQLWREIRGLGYEGHYAQVNKWLRPLRRKPAPSVAKKHLRLPPTSSVASRDSLFPSAKRLAWLLLRRPDSLDHHEQHLLQQISRNTLVGQASQLALEFRSLIQNRESHHLHTWLQSCATSGIKPLETFALGLERDLDAVLAALELPWSNGQTEGQVNRLKLLKRQGYGRANLDLLRIRATYLPP